jgi:hypothetical protein
MISLGVGGTGSAFSFSRASLEKSRNALWGFGGAACERRGGGRRKGASVKDAAHNHT